MSDLRAVLDYPPRVEVVDDRISGSRGFIFKSGALGKARRDGIDTLEVTAYQSGTGELIGLEATYKSHGDRSKRAWPENVPLVMGLLLGDKRLSFPGRYSMEIIEGFKVEELACWLTKPDLATIGTSPSLEGRIGGTEFSLTEEQVEKLHEFCRTVAPMPDLHP